MFNIPSPSRLTKDFVLFETFLGWSDARDYCRARGGDLATISSSDEMSAVASDLDSRNIRAWIGLNDLTEESSFVWADGSPSMYRNFGLQQPDSNRGKGEEDCVHTSIGGSWNDLTCSDRQPAVLCAMCQHTSCTPEVSAPLRALNI
jgi:hypothetical protein